MPEKRAYHEKFRSGSCLDAHSHSLPGWRRKSLRVSRGEDARYQRAPADNVFALAQGTGGRTIGMLAGSRFLVGDVVPMGGRRLPVVYSCSGCSNVAQMANYLALCLDRGGHAEMSCIAGVGGDVPSLVQLAGSGRDVVALDGCSLHCVKHCLARHEVSPKHHVTLTRFGVQKCPRMEFSEDQAVSIFRVLVGVLEGRVDIDRIRTPA